MKIRYNFNMKQTLNRIQKTGVAILLFSFIAGGLLSSVSCSSAYRKMVGADSDHVFSKVFVADYGIGWEAVIDALKASPIETLNRENGIIQTKWIDNTAERNMLDANGGVIPYVKAQFRFRVTLAKGFYEGRPSVRVSVQKEQQYQRDVLEGWRNLETDGIQENSMLYRIGKLIEFKSRILKIENEQLKKQLDQVTPN